MSHHARHVYMCLVVVDHHVDCMCWQTLHPQPGVINEELIIAAIEEERALQEEEAVARATQASASSALSRDDLKALLCALII